MLILGIWISFILLVIFLVLSLFKDLKTKKEELENLSLEFSILKIKSGRINYIKTYIDSTKLPEVNFEFVIE